MLSHSPGSHSQWVETQIQVWAARLRWEERDPGDEGSQDQDGLPQFLLRPVLSEERTGPPAPCPLHSQGLTYELGSPHTYLQELKSSAGP